MTLDAATCLPVSALQLNCGARASWATGSSGVLFSSVLGAGLAAQVPGAALREGSGQVTGVCGCGGRQLLQVRGLLTLGDLHICFWGVFCVWAIPVCVAGAKTVISLAVVSVSTRRH